MHRAFWLTTGLLIVAGIITGLAHLDVASAVCGVASLVSAAIAMFLTPS